MFRNSIITNTSLIIKFLSALNFKLYLTKPQLQHMALIISSMIMKGYNGKVIGYVPVQTSRAAYTL